METKAKPPLRSVLVLLLITLLAAGAFFLILQRGRSRVSRLSDANLLVITLDTSRYDRIGAAGYKTARTPRLDALAREGVWFENARSPVPLTLPAHTTIFTGAYPIRHRVRNNGNYLVPPDIRTLAEVLRERGYATAAFVSAFVLDSRYGLDRGFDIYDDHMNEDRRVSNWQPERRAEETVGAFAEWLKSHSGGRFFAWVHFFDPHMPYAPPAPFDRLLADPYDGEIAYMDAQVGRVLDLLGERGLRERTLIVVAGDHGEAFGEHIEIEHSVFCYEENVRVPLLLSCPGCLPEGRRVRDAASLADVAPTILDFLSLPSLPEAQGVSLLPAAAGRKLVDRDLYFESLYAEEDLGAAALTGFISKNRKFIDLPRPELYDLEDDPGEKVNLAEGGMLPGEIRNLIRRLEDLKARLRSSDVEVRTAPTWEESERLAALGYLAPAPRRPMATERPDPKDLIPSLVELIRGRQHAAAGRPAEAEESFRRSLALNPKLISSYSLLAELYLRLGRKEDAVSVFRDGLARNPDDPRLKVRFASFLITLDHFDEARNHLLGVERSGLYEDRLRLYSLLALAAERRRDFGEAANYYQKALAFESSPALRSRAAYALYKAERYDEALDLYRGLESERPNEPQILHEMALCFALSGRAEEAGRYFEKAMAAGSDSKIYFNYALFMADQGDFGRASALLEKFLAVAAADDPKRREAQRYIEDWKKRAARGA